MTPGARIAAACDILDDIIGGAAAEKTLTNWTRKSRFAGSGDRVAIRDLVFDALRCRRSYGWLGGSDTGRGLMIGALRSQDTDAATVFTGQGYGPAPLSEAELQLPDIGAAPPAVRLDLPDWLWQQLEASLGDDFGANLALMQDRAPVFLRANLRYGTRTAAAASLLEDGIETAAHPLSDTALTALTNQRKIQMSKAYLDGLVELQDAASQAVVDALPLRPGQTVLDYCAGGGGKALGIAARADVTVIAHDIDADRMQDIPTRAARAGVSIACLDQVGVSRVAPFDLVLCDAPCSGSGSWRRAPEAKWRLTSDRLDALCRLQAEILDKAAPLVQMDGVLAYVTCSLLNAENQDQITVFLARNPGWTLISSHRFTPLDGGDGFYLALLQRLTVRL